MSSAQEVKDDRRYTKDHEWAVQQGHEILIGITAFAVDQLGDITLVNIDAKPGTTFEAHKPFGTIESVKTLSDLFLPLAGTVTRVNQELENSPELINQDPWGKGWIIAITPNNLAGEWSSLLSAQDYQKLLQQADH